MVADTTAGNPTFGTDSVTARSVDPSDFEPKTGMVWALRDSWTEAVRHLRIIPRNMELMMFATLQPIMFVLLFNYVFGGAISAPGFEGDYTQFLLPGVFAQTVVFGSAFTGIGLATDMEKGYVDRLRTLPISQSAVLVGRTISDFVRNTITFTVMLIVGFLIGFRFEGGWIRGLLACGLLLGVQLCVQLDPGVDRPVGEVGGGGQLGRVHLDVPDDVRLVGLRADRVDAGLAADDRRREPVHHRHQRLPRPLQRIARRQRRVDRAGVGHGPGAGVRLLSVRKFTRTLG